MRLCGYQYQQRRLGQSAGKYDTAQKVYDVVNQVFKYAVKLRLSLFNPAAELRGELAKVEQKHYRFIKDPQRIGEMLRAFDGYAGFTQQDPIRLKGGTNFYNFAASTTNSVDVLGLTNFKYHGNWCGPGWTGGHWESYSSQNDKNGYYKQPIDMMDKACQNHDKCYAQCRETFPCNKQLRGQCMTQCDRDLGRASENTKISSQNSYANKFGLELWMNHNNFPDAGDNAVSCYDGLTHVPNRAPSANEFFNMLIR